ncbi:hypothetical protein HHI36_006812 [Cryptolaemus montrouzieri]|uniref:Uncharacterized protein n=1 Tax=Cryptolaemus montrouzieri TaxID=559131 RepID=A0ABD2NYY8_9CUCU
MSNQNATPLNPNPPPRTFNSVNSTPIPVHSFSNNSQRSAHNRSIHFRQHIAQHMDRSSSTTKRSINPQTQAQNPNEPKCISEELFLPEIDNNLDRTPNLRYACELNYNLDEPSDVGEVNLLRNIRKFSVGVGIREPPLINLTNLTNSSFPCIKIP